VLFAGPPKDDEYEHRRAGIRAHNRWMKDFCDRKPAQRAGIGQFFLNDIDDAIDDIHWIKDNGLRGGVLLPTVAPDVKWVKPIYHPDYDRIWAVLEELELPVNLHSGTGSPDYGRFPSTPAIMISEVGFYGQRAFVHMLLSGVFERFPRLKFVMTEGSAAAIPPMLEHLDNIIANVRRGAIGELKYTEENSLKRSATEYFQQNCWVGASFPGKQDWAAASVMAPGRFMWGSDYPHDEGTAPFTREHLRQLFHDTDPTELQQILAGNAARLYDFSLDALAPLANEFGPTVAELARPLDALPENPNEALMKAVGKSGL
jgi:predicted TIM-barrel fold metal-dependent hydrolase